MNLSREDTRRFWSKVVRRSDDECWVWAAATVGGYGTFKTGGRQVKAHRIAYALEVGPIPEGQIVCHRCDVPNCVNPSHLFLGTHADNAADRNRKNRQATGARTKPERRARGEAASGAKLTEDEVLNIRYSLRAGNSVRSVARYYGVSPSAVQFIKSGHTWRHVDG